MENMQKPRGIMDIALLQILLTKERKMPLTGFGWIAYTKTEDYRKRLQEINKLKK